MAHRRSTAHRTAAGCTLLKPRHLEVVLAANPIAEASSFHALPKQQSRRLVPMVDLSGGISPLGGAKKVSGEPR